MTIVNDCCYLTLLTVVCIHAHGTDGRTIPSVPPAINRSIFVSYAVLLEVLVLSEGQLVGLLPEEVVAHDPSILLVHLTIKKQLLCLMKEEKEKSIAILFKLLIEYDMITMS